MVKHFYTYAYLRVTGTPYYIGKGYGKRAYSGHGYINLPSDRSRILILKSNLSEEEAFKHEIYMISVFGRKDKGTGILLNRTDGGEGPTGSIRKDLSNYNSTVKKGSTLNKDHVEKVRQSVLKRGVMPYMAENGRRIMLSYHERRKSDPELNEKFLETVRQNGKIMGPINGRKNKGKTFPPEINAKKSCPGERNGMFGKIRITNGVENKQIDRDQPIPEGFWRGMTRFNKRTESQPDALD